MTAAEKLGARATSVPRPSLLPFDPADLMAMRVRPAQFARMCDVSKQTVSRWIAVGKVTLGPDGKLDPAKACDQVIARSDPARIRARVFRDVTATHGELRERIEGLERALQEARAAHQVDGDAARFRAEEAAAHGISRVCDALLARFDEARDAYARGSLAAWLEELVAVEFYGQDLETFRRELADDAAMLRSEGECQDDSVPPVAFGVESSQSLWGE